MSKDTSARTFFSADYCEGSKEAYQTVVNILSKYKEEGMTAQQVSGLVEIFKEQAKSLERESA